MRSPRSHRRLSLPLVVLVLSVLLLPVTARGDDGARRISRGDFEDRVRGGWAGQMIGVSFGAPTEFHSNGQIIEGALPEWQPDHVSNAIDQDDLYVEMTFAAVMDRIGLDATTAQYGDAFRTSQYNLWHANAAARRLLNLGIEAPRSGQPQYNPHANDIDFQIESDFIGLMSPGLPRAARDYSLRLGRVMNAGDGLYGGLFITGMYAAAFFETDPHRVVEAGLAMLPRNSEYAAIIRDVLAWHDADPGDWRATWHRIEDKWDRNDACPDGSLEPFNIDAKLNGAYVALGLLYGNGDFDRTLDVATRSGQDSDCNPSSAGGILGVMLGYEKIPDKWKAGIPALAGRKFAYTDYSFDDIVASTVKRAGEVVRLAGGTADGDALVIPRQSARPPALEQWDMGVPQQIVPANGDAWRWGPGWSPIGPGRDGNARVGFASEGPGAEVTLRFSGTAVTLLGGLSQQGGRADVFLDGKPAAAIDAWIPERTHDDALWHVYGLKPGAHQLKIVTTGAADSRSTGTRVEVWRAIVYAKSAH
jgi:ADP-ribosylglycohydrolase